MKIYSLSSKNKLLLTTGITLLLLTSKVTNAASETTSFTVSASVTDVCQNLTANNISFGSYNPLSATPSDSNGSVEITCTNNTSYSIALSQGGAGSYSSRKLNDGGSNNMNYNLYTSSDYTTIWGDGTASTSTINETGNGSAQTTTVFGRITAGQSVPSGRYSDTINVTVTY